jgi:mono/diheme cytochrome c family protein
VKPSRILLATFLLSAATYAQHPTYVTDPDWQVPADAAAKANPLAGKTNAAAGGKKLFLRNCAECHGDDGRGNAKKNSADFHLSSVQAQSDGALFWKITNGNLPKKMPSFSRLPEIQRWQLVLYLRTLKDPQ